MCICSDLKHIVYFSSIWKNINHLFLWNIYRLKNYSISVNIKHSDYGKSTVRVIYSHSTAHRSAFGGKGHKLLEIMSKTLEVKCVHFSRGLHQILCVVPDPKQLRSILLGIWEREKRMSYQILQYTDTMTFTINLIAKWEEFAGQDEMNGSLPHNVWLNCQMQL